MSMCRRTQEYDNVEWWTVIRKGDGIAGVVKTKNFNPDNPEWKIHSLPFSNYKEAKEWCRRMYRMINKVEYY